MVFEKTKNTINGTIWGFLNKIITIICPFFIRTIILYKLGTEYLGLSSLFTAILNVLNLVDLNFGAAIVFCMYKPVANDDEDTIRALLNYFRKIYLVIGTIITVIGLLILPFLGYLISNSYPSDINIYVLYLIYLSNASISYFLLGYQQSILSAYQREDIKNKISFFLKILIYIAEFLIIYFLKNYYLYTLCILIFTFLYNLFCSIVIKKKFPNYYCNGKLSIDLKKELKLKIKGIVIYKVGWVIQSSIDSIVISSFFGLSILGIYNNYTYISTAIVGFVSILFQSMQAGVGNYLQNNGKDSHIKLFKIIFFINAWLTIFCTACLLCLYQPFMLIWNGGDASFLLSIEVVVAICFLFFSDNLMYSVGIYRETLGMWNYDKFRPLVISLLNLIGTLISAYLGSLLGIILSTAIPVLFVSIPWESKVIFNKYFGKSSKMFLINIATIFLLCIFICAFSYYICSLIQIAGILGFILKGLTVVIISNLLLFLLFFRKKEFLESVKYAKKAFKIIKSSFKKKAS